MVKRKKVFCELAVLVLSAAHTTPSDTDYNRLGAKQSRQMVLRTTSARQLLGGLPKVSEHRNTEKGCSFRQPQFVCERLEFFKVLAVLCKPVFANGEVFGIARVDGMSCQNQTGYFGCNIGAVGGLFNSPAREKISAGGCGVQAVGVSGVSGLFRGGVDHG